MAMNAVSAELPNTDLASAAESLMNGARRDRQEAAAVFAASAGAEPSSIAPYLSSIVESIGRPEPRTRMACIDVLTACCLAGDEAGISASSGALEAVEGALFDDDNGKVQLAAVRFFAAYGATSPQASLAAWPVIDDSLQCFHGNPEFFDMLNAVLQFASSDIDPEVKKGLASRMAFDATNSKGLLQKRAKLIVQAAKGK